MSTPESTPPEPTSLAAPPSGEIPLPERVLAAQQRLLAEARELAARAKALGVLGRQFQPLTKPRGFADLSRVPAALEKIERRVATMPLVSEAGSRLIAEIREAVAEVQLRQRNSLARDLQAACAERGLTYRVVSREEPVEIRLPPFAVVIDRERGRAELRFARLPVAQCASEAAEILDCRERSQRELDAGFDERRFFEAARRAWQCARGGADDPTIDRVEILDFLPYLALQFQTPAFRVEPSTANYRGYSRARFAWAVARLRKSGALTQQGWRLNLGVATGTTASKKNRVLWFEDEHGEGEYKLTVFFTRTETPT